MFEESRVFQETTAPSLATMTGESYQPARIYYQVGQKNAVLGRFKRLRCIDCDRQGNNRTWLKFLSNSYLIAIANETLL